MKKLFKISLLLAALNCSLFAFVQGQNSGYDVDGKSTNNMFDDAEVTQLSMPTVAIGGEVKNPGTVNFSSLPLTSLIVKESVYQGDTMAFKGAFRYEGYSLMDILNLYILEKANATAFPPIVDLYVEIENDKKEKVVFSWGEIFYPNKLNSIIIATKVMRIVPVKTGEKWDLPKENKIVCNSDMVTERNISNPTKITIRSYKNDAIKIEKDKNPSFSDTITISVKGKTAETITGYPEKMQQKSIRTLFYGRGRGFHSNKAYNGMGFGELVMKNVNCSKQSISRGLVVVVSDDGYRSVFSYSEICNRNDQAEGIINYNSQKKNGGAFRLQAGFDFFSDRAVKSISDIFYIENE